MKKEVTAEYLTTRQLAHLWQVSEATIKRWADAGHLRPTKTLGGHRRFALPDVARFQRERGLSGGPEELEIARLAALSDSPEASAQAEVQERFFDAIVTGWADTATSILLKLYLDKVPLALTLDGMVTLTMHRIGASWHSGEMSVADEHLASRTMLRTLETTGNLLRQETGQGQLALCCAVEEELHEIAVHCAQLVLENEGWTVRNFGANTPLFALAIAVEKHRPQLVCLSSTMNTALDRNAREYPQFRAAVLKCGARVVLGGEGFRDEVVRSRFPADLYAENFHQLREFIQG